MASIPLPPRERPAALVGRHVVFLDCARDSRLLVRRIDDCHELRQRPLDVLDGPGVGFLLLGCCSLRHGGELTNSI
jgi:hypothetical protein